MGRQADGKRGDAGGRGRRQYRPPGTMRLDQVQSGRAHRFQRSLGMGAEGEEQRGRAMLTIRDVTCTLLRGAAGSSRGYPLIRVWSDDGLVGVGEASPMSGQVTKAAVEHQLKPLLVGMNALDLEACWEKMYVA